MSFRSVNEIDQFSFEDCVVSELHICGPVIRLTLEALRVLPHNSQNTNFTESYAGTVMLTLTEGTCISAAKEGYRYYNANGVLQTEIPDAPLPLNQLPLLEETLKESYLFSFELDAAPTEKRIGRLRFELPKEEIYDTTPTETYELAFSYEDAVFSWDRYMNRVGN